MGAEKRKHMLEDLLTVALWNLLLLSSVTFGKCFMDTWKGACFPVIKICFIVIKTHYFFVNCII